MKVVFDENVFDDIDHFHPNFDESVPNRCGLPLDSRGHHRAACAVVGVLGRRGFALESAAARVCREAGARVSLDVRVQDMDLARPDALDNRRLEVVADGLPLFQGQWEAGRGPSPTCREPRRSCT